MATKTKKRKGTKGKAKAKRTAGKKTAAKKTAAKKTKSAGRKPKHDRKELGKQVDALIKEGLAWNEIALQLGVDAGTARFAHDVFKVKPKDRITGTDAEIAKAIVAARDDENQAWGKIMARSGLGMGKVKAIYQEASGNSANQGYKVVQRRAALNGDGPAAKKKSGKTKAKKSTKAKGRKPRKRKNPS